MDQAQILMITPAWQSQSWYSCLFQITVKNPILIPQINESFNRPKAGMASVNVESKIKTSALRKFGERIFTVAVSKKTEDSRCQKTV